MGPASKVYVQYGAGLCGPAAWMNFDISPTLRLQRLPLVGRLFTSVGPRFPESVRYGDIVTGLPLKWDLCDAMYCSHVLEHLSLHDLRQALRNTFRHLKPGKRFRFVVPDLEQLAADYLADQSPGAAITFMEDSYLGKATRPRGVAGLLRQSWGNSSHLWMWDYKSLAKELKDVGFQGVRRAEFGDSGDTMFDAVEDERRWHKCLGMECWRP